jgi:hypothetical protein
MTLAGLAQLVLRLLGVTQTVEALVNGLTLAFNGWKIQWDQLVAPITGTYAIVNDVAHGNVAIKAAIDSMTGSGTYDLNAILAAIAALPAGSDIVIPPAGDNAEAVWLYQGGMRDQAGNMLGKLDETNFKLGPRAAYIAPATPWFALYYPTSFID